MAQTFLQIALDTPLGKLFDYLPPDNIETKKLTPGMRLLVPFGRQEMVGILVNLSNHSDVPKNKLRPAKQLLDQSPLFDQTLLDLAKWISRYYHYPLGKTLSCFMPGLLRKGKDTAINKQLYWRIVPKAKPLDWDNFKRSPKQLKALRSLDEKSELSQGELFEQAVSQQILKTLADKNLIEFFYKEQDPLIKDNQEILTQPLQLNNEQQLAVSEICNALGKFQPFLLDGVTGSGKTEVYFHCIAQALERDQQVLVLVPEIGLTPQTISRFKQRFSQPICVSHSNLTDKQRLQSWMLCKRNQAKILIGTRSALFTPFANLGLIIIDESHDSSFKQHEGLRYSARDSAIVRAKLENIPIVLGSATPSFETLHNAQTNRYQHLKLTQRAGNAKPPNYHLLDIRSKHLQAGLCADLIGVMKKHIAQQKQIIIFLNRRGYSPVLICHDCGWVANCQRCDAKMTLHLRNNYLHCHHCGSAKPAKSNCPDCKQSKLLPLGTGTQRLEEMLGKIFPKIGIARIDADSTRRKGALQEILAGIESGKNQILIGTQMLAKGHHFPNVTLVAVIDADGGFFSSDFRGSERCAQLLLQVAGRAGRAEQQGEVYIQTRHPQHPLLKNLLDKGYHHFATQHLQERAQAQFPPFSHLALFRAEAKKENISLAFLQEIKQLAQQINPQINLLGPVPAPMQRRKGYFRAQLLVQTDQRASLQEGLEGIINKIQQVKIAKQVRWSLDVDPIDMY